MASPRIHAVRDRLLLGCGAVAAVGFFNCLASSGSIAAQADSGLDASSVPDAEIDSDADRNDADASCSVRRDPLYQAAFGDEAAGGVVIRSDGKVLNSTTELIYLGSGTMTLALLGRGDFVKSPLGPDGPIRGFNNPEQIYLGPRAFAGNPKWVGRGVATDPSASRSAVVAVDYDQRLLLAGSVADDDGAWSALVMQASDPPPASQEWGTYPESDPWTTGLMVNGVSLQGSKIRVVGSEGTKALAITFDVAAGSPNGAALRPRATMIDAMHEADSIAVVPDGAWIAGIGSRASAARLTAAGDLDTAVGTAGVIEVGEDTSENAAGIAVDVKGRIYVAYSAPTGPVKLARLQPTGGIDTTFGNAGRVTTPLLNPKAGHLDIIVESSGALWLAGLLPASGGPPVQSAVVRITEDGKLDPVIGTGGVGALPAFNPSGRGPAPQRVLLRASPDIGQCQGHLYVDLLDEVPGLPTDVIWAVLP
jgi:hypothetical protein